MSSAEMRTRARIRERAEHVIGSLRQTPCRDRQEDSERLALIVKSASEEAVKAGARLYRWQQVRAGIAALLAIGGFILWGLLVGGLHWHLTSGAVVAVIVVEGVWLSALAGPVMLWRPSEPSSKREWLRSTSFEEGSHRDSAGLWSDSAVVLVLIAALVVFGSASAIASLAISHPEEVVAVAVAAPASGLIFTIPVVAIFSLDWLFSAFRWPVAPPSLIRLALLDTLWLVSQEDEATEVERPRRMAALRLGYAVEELRRKPPFGPRVGYPFGFQLEAGLSERCLRIATRFSELQGELLLGAEGNGGCVMRLERAFIQACEGRWEDLEADQAISNRPTGHTVASRIGGALALLGAAFGLPALLEGDLNAASLNTMRGLLVAAAISYSIAPRRRLGELLDQIGPPEKR